MASIEMNLKRIQDSKDLSYSNNVSDNFNHIESTEKLDSITLARLIDECREE